MLVSSAADTCAAFCRVLAANHLLESSLLRSPMGIRSIPSSLDGLELLDLRILITRHAWDQGLRKALV